MIRHFHDLRFHSSGQLRRPPRVTVDHFVTDVDTTGGHSRILQTTAERVHT